MKNFTILIKIVLAVLFLICLLPLPYGYYELIRLIALIGFSLLAYDVSHKENKTEMIIYIGLAILFQPLIKISLGRTLWNIVDVIVAIGLLLSILRERNTKS